MPTVYAPQQPSVLDKTTKVWVPTVSFEAATRFGDVKIMMPPNTANMMAAPIVDVLKEKLANYDEDDYLLAVGNPTLIAASAAIISRKSGGKINLLQWDRQTRDYIVVKIRI